jgi:peptide/nickel transport system substrate-binding protein
MKKTRYLALASAGAAISLAIAACGGGSSSKSGGGGTTTSSVSYNQGAATVVNPSSHPGGTLIYLNPTDWDSPDPGNTYYGYSWDFSRLYARTLLTYKATPGSSGLQLVPDLATSLGQVSNNGLTWTYHLKPNLKMEDGETITSQMVKYAVERTASYSKAGQPAVLPNGPVYWHAFLTDPNYPGAYYDKSPGKLGLAGISTPDASTVVFHLSKPMAEFDNLVAMSQTAPVPPAKDTGTKYQLHPLSSGPYMFQGNYAPGKGFTLVKNPMWSASSDSVRKQLVDKIEVTVNVNAADLDNRLIAGDANFDVSGTGLSPNDQARVLTNPNLKKNTDDVLDGFMLYTAINTVVPPFNNIHCRMAVEYVADHVQLQTAYGGPYGGQIATQALPPMIAGYQQGYDPYSFNANPHGDVTAAKQQLQLCGKPSGFSTTIAARANRPKEVAGAQALQASLTKIGIKADIYQYPAGNIASVVGTPDFVHKHGLGLMQYGWGADWPKGFGFLYAIVDGTAITPAGNSNIQELNDPVVNQDLSNVMANNDEGARTAIYTQVDQQVMKDAVILPIVYEKALLWRSPNATNVFYNPSMLMYDYSQIGLK